ncbi:MAG: GerW family sporulation protein [Sphingomonadaceae bacterium]
MAEQTEGRAPGGPAEMGTADVLDRIAALLRDLISMGRADAAFGEPRTIGDRTIIPVAEVMYGFGAGMGSGQGPGPQGQPSGGAGGGSGGGMRSRPVAAIVVGPEGVTVQPVVDVTQIGMAALVAGVFSVLWLKRLGKRATPAGEPAAKSLIKLMKGR